MPKEAIGRSYLEKVVSSRNEGLWVVFRAMIELADCERCEEVGKNPQRVADWMNIRYE